MRAIPVLLLPLLLLAACGEKQEPMGAKVAQGEGLEVPAFSFLERGGRPYGLEDLKGKVWVASFIFTRCRTTCIPMCGEMMELQDEFEDEPDFRIVATTVDPGHDTAERLKKFGEGYGADPERWLFLTGKKEAIKEFAHGGLKIQWHPEDPLIHSTYFVLVDREGRIRDYFNQTRREEMERLRKVIRTLLGEKTP
ncbi:MAG: SCO family protein [Planctomycetota bacterium]|jgi:protein SCO1/2